MNLQHGRIERLAIAVAEHARVAWDEELRRARSGEERALIEEFRTLQLISRLPAEAPRPPARLGDFTLLREIGRGATGVVYEALQISLGRRVALKILSPEATASRAKVERFKREARALASLEHPHIVTVHTVETVGDLHFLTMELVTGKPLDVCIPRHGMPVDRFLDLAISMADAVSSAHGDGIIHRDLKPANIMVADDGWAKVLDFGLAKLRDVEGPLASTGGASFDRSLTIRGALVGTVPYMSPEQIKGGPVDARSDLFSLGAILYQMITGRRPFEGRRAGEVMGNILRECPPSVLETRRDVPADLGRIVRHCLQKDPDRRYQTAKGLRGELEELQADLRAGPDPRSRPESALFEAISRYWHWPVVAMLILMSVAGYLLWGPTPPPTWRSTQLTLDPGWEAEPALSPDGTQVAYAAEWEGNVDIWVTEATGGAVLKLTSDRAVDRLPAWYPDGTQIAFVSDRTGSDSIWKVPRLGGPESLLISDAIDPAISPDGSRIAFAHPGASGALRVAVAPLDDIGRARELTDGPNGTADHRHPSWSPDGRSIVFQADHDLWTVDLDGGESTRITSSRGDDRYPVWSPDGRFIYFDSRRGGSRAVWRVSPRGGEAERLTPGSGPEAHPDISGEGRRLVYSTHHVDTDMVMIDLASRTRMRFEDTRSLSSPVFAPSGQSLVFSSDRDGEFGLWSRPLPGDGTRGGVRKLTRQRGDAEQCAISPDGLRVAYSRRFGARTDIWIVSTRGGPARRFTDDATIDLHPAWSRDGTRLAFVSDRDGRPHVWVAPAEGSAVPEDARQVTAGEGVDAHPVWIGDDDAIAFIRTSGADRDVWTVSLDELAPPRRLSFGAGARFVRWSAMDGALWVAATWGTGSVELRQLSIDDGAITPFSPPLILGPSTSVAYFDISDDGRHLAYVEREVSGDIWTLDADRGRF